MVACLLLLAGVAHSAPSKLWAEEVAVWTAILEQALPAGTAVEVATKTIPVPPSAAGMGKKARTKLGAGKAQLEQLRRGSETPVDVPDPLVSAVGAKGGLTVAVSRVSFAADGNSALVYYTSSDGESAMGFVARLVRTDKGWILKKTVTIWVS